MKPSLAAPARHDAHGWWIAEAGAPPALDPLRGAIDADVLVLGGGFTGLWTAWHAIEAEPAARVVVVEADRCSTGPSGRNGGFASTLHLSRPSLVAAYGPVPAQAIVDASVESVRAIGAFCEREGVDAWYHAAPHLVLATAPAQDGVSADAVDGVEVHALGRREARSRCDSPIVRGGVEVRSGATVHPARLAFGLRSRLLARGVSIFESTPVRTLRADGGVMVAGTPHGSVRAVAVAVAIGAASGVVAPLRRRLTVSSSHIVITEPVPDVIEELGWTGGEAISDARALLHYFRTTRDGRILFGWAGGRMAAGARTGGRMDVDPEVIARVARDLVRFFPQLEGRRIDHAWGGPIDVSPTHLPMIVSLPGGRAHAAFGYTGNGVAPSHLSGRILAALALDRRDDLSRLAIVDPPMRRVPPEPLRVIGAATIRRALIRKEEAEERGGVTDPITRAVAGLPGRIGVHIVR